jgi:IS30 family transposase
MTGNQKIRLEIQQLTLSGYTQEKIADKLNISVSTVSRTLRKLRKSSSQWLTNLAERDMAHIFHESLQGFQQDIMYLNELLEDESIRNNPKLQLQIRREITQIRSKYLEHLLKAPMVWSMSVFTSKYSPEPIVQPTMNSLGGISGV